ncbi:hypothetical protein NKG05_25265 [Oerskovia sp. M15]
MAPGATATSHRRSPHQRSCASPMTRAGSRVARLRRLDVRPTDHAHRRRSRRSGGLRAAPGAARSAPRRDRDGSHARNYSAGFFAKLALMAVIDALGVYVVWAAWSAESYGILAAMLAMLGAANWVYFSKRALPLKYILPGLIFLLAYQIFVVAYTGYIAFTNYGTGHNSTKEQAVEALLVQNERRVEGSESAPLTVLEDGGTLAFAIVTPDGDVEVGTAEQPLSVVDDAVVTGGRAAEVPASRSSSAARCSSARTRSRPFGCPSPTTRRTARSARLTP